MASSGEKIDGIKLATPTPGRLRHPLLDPMASYVSAFGPEALAGVVSDIRYFYTEEEYPRLQERLEFALACDGTEPPALRYYLYRLFNCGLIADYFEAQGCPRGEVEGLLQIMSPVTPEFAVAQDLSPGSRRLKLGCMMRDRILEGGHALADALERLGSHLGVKADSSTETVYGKIFAVAMDFFQDSPRRDLKIYRALPPDLDAIEGRLADLPSLGTFLPQILEVLGNAPPETGWIPMFSLRTTNLRSDSVGYSFHAYVPRNLWTEMDKTLLRVAPGPMGQVRRLFARVRDRGWDVVVGHVGTSLSATSGREKLHIYFSVV